MVGVAAALLIARDAAADQRFATTAGSSARPASGFVRDLQDERRLAVEYLSDPSRTSKAVLAAQAKTDADLRSLGAAMAGFAKIAPEQFTAVQAAGGQRMAAVPQLRSKVIDRQLTVQEAADGYSSQLDSFLEGDEVMIGLAATAQIAKANLLTSDLFRIQDWRSQTDSLAAGVYSSAGLTTSEFAEFRNRIGGYRGLIEITLPRLSVSEQAQLKSIMASTAWTRLTQVENTALETAATPQAPTAVHRAGTLPVSRTEWLAASAEVTSKLINLYVTHSDIAYQQAHDHAQGEYRRALYTGLGLLFLAALVFAVVTRMSSRLIGRLRRLQKETLELATQNLPEMVERLRNGEQVDVATALPQLDHGIDEIGQVATAFNQAQLAAVTAAAKEAETRAGTGKVFLNIAHRNQIIAHQQLKVLDQAERSQEDPDQLNLLFQLDHLATRARRNAENLIILGGGQAGRRWRNPVPLLQVVRSAIGEAETYVRVSTGQLPPVALTGGAVADVIHLLAELVDNATNFSPPSARVEVRGNVVGKGIVIEIEDQGLGIEPGQLQDINTMLSSPPDFGVMALSDEPRLGLFVVTQLASRHGVRVTLADSPSYGGTRAVVLIPSSLIASTLPEQPELDSGRGPEQFEIMQGGGGGSGPPRIPSRRASRVITLAPSDPPVQIRPQAGPPAISQDVPRLPPEDRPPERARQTSEIPVVRREGVGSSDFVTQKRSWDTGQRDTGQRDTGQRDTGQRDLGQRGPGQRDQRDPGGHRDSAQRPSPAPGRDGRPTLPRRTRQAHLAPQLLDETLEAAATAPPAEEPYLPSAEYARDRLAAFQRGTRQGRKITPDPTS